MRRWRPGIRSGLVSATAAAVLAALAGSAAAVQYKVYPLDQGKPVPNAQVVLSPELPATPIDPAQPAGTGGITFKEDRPAAAAQPESSAQLYQHYLRAFSSQWQLSTGLSYSPRPEEYQMAADRAHQWSSAATIDPLTVPSRSMHWVPRNMPGGYPFVTNSNASGEAIVDLDRLPSANGWKPEVLGEGRNVYLWAGIECEVFGQTLPTTGAGSSIDATYEELCEDDCWWSYGHFKKGMNYCLHGQQPQTAPSSAPAATDMASQPAFRKLGLPLALPWERLAPVTVAVIDSGLDYRHPSFKPEALWQNAKPGAPGASYANDLFGWDFVGRHNNPKDDIGHGTFVTGIILAVNPKARIMPVKVLNGLGHGMNSDVNRAIVYAVDRGARVVNLSVGAQGVSALSQEVVDYARERGVLIVAAGGNEGLDTAQYTPAGLRGVLTVAGVDDNDKKPNFGNWGQHVALAAPGVNIVSWRAAWSDFVHVMTAGKEPVAANVVGADRWLYRASGTSFAAPFVSGAASVLFALYPNLTAGQVARMLVESADDTEVPGWDQYTGAGRLNIGRAVFADPNRYLTARIARIAPARQGAQTVVEVHGTADGNTLASYQVQLGQGESPTSWKTVAVEKDKRVVDGLVAAFPVREITARGKWSVRVIVQDTAGRVKEARGSLDVR